MSGLTHNHLRAKIACGLYYFMVCGILEAKQETLEKNRSLNSDTGTPAEEIRPASADFISVLQKGLARGFAYYGKYAKEIRIDEASGASYMRELSCYDRIRNLEHFAVIPCDQICSHGYVVDTVEAALWCLVTTGSYRECALKAVNLGHDTDTIAAIAGGLAGLWYGYESIPEEWRTVIQHREWIEDMCCRAKRMFSSLYSDIVESESGNSEKD